MQQTRLVEPSSHGWRAASLGWVAALSFAILTALVIANHTVVVDRQLILSLRAVASPLLTTMLLAVTFTSGPLAIPAALAFAVGIYRRSGTRAALCYVAACVTGQLLDVALKYDIDRARPRGISPRLTSAGGLSYPSADAMLAVLIFGLGTVMLTWSIESRRLRVIMLVAATLFVVCASVARVYLGAHWPSDVLGGVLAGTACAAFFARMARREPPVAIVVAAREA